MPKSKQPVPVSKVLEIAKLHRKHTVKPDKHGNITLCGWCGGIGKHKKGCKLGH